MKHSELEFFKIVTTEVSYCGCVNMDFTPLHHSAVHYLVNFKFPDSYFKQTARFMLAYSCKFLKKLICLIATAGSLEL